MFHRSRTSPHFVTHTHTHTRSHTCTVLVTQVTGRVKQGGIYVARVLKQDNRQSRQFFGLDMEDRRRPATALGRVPLRLPRGPGAAGISSSLSYHRQPTSHLKGFEAKRNSQCTTLKATRDAILISREGSPARGGGQSGNVCLLSLNTSNEGKFPSPAIRLPLLIYGLRTAIMLYLQDLGN